MTKKEIGQTLRQLREDAGLSRDQVAAVLEKSVKTIGHWESGYATPDANMLFLMCSIYAVSAGTGEPLGNTYYATKISVPSRAPNIKRLDSWISRFQAVFLCFC